MLKLFLAAGLAVIVLSALVCAEGTAAAEVKARYAECVKLEKTAGVKRYQFQRAMVGNALGPWKKENSSAENVYDYLTVYVLNGQLRSAGLEQSSPSGDWASKTTYCFRQNGSLAFQYQVLGTFYQDGGGDGPIEVQWRSYFDPAGKRFQTLETILNAKTRKPVKATYYRFTPPSFLRSSELVKAVGKNLLPAR